jgi:hypothetical protein
VASMLIAAHQLPSAPTGTLTALLVVEILLTPLKVYVMKLNRKTSMFEFENLHLWTKVPCHR